MSRAGVGFVDGSSPKFADETRALLLTRLRAAATIASAILGVVFVGSMIQGATELLPVRIVILAGLTTIAIALHRWQSPSLARLRQMELVVFGAFFGQVAIMMVTRLQTFSAEHDAESTIAALERHVCAWCILILSYGIFMPNSWKRGAAVMIPLALIPYGLIYVLRNSDEQLNQILGSINFQGSVPITLVAAAVGIYGTHVINSVRREAFKAKQFGQYRIGDRLGGGGMGVVHKAEHVLLKRPCAIKLIKPENEADARAVADFEKEVKTTARLTHWNTVEIFDYGRTDDGTFYYVMELLPGLSLEELVERHGTLEPSRVVFLLRQICQALAEAHDVGLIHRDLKPANIFVTWRGRQFDVAKLLDFGLVKERQTGGNNDTESRRLLSGTPLYMSPEQATSYDEVDGRSDIYSLGCVAYHLLTGRPPFTGETVLAILAAHRMESVVPLSEIASEIPDDLSACVLKCLEKDVNQRYEDVSQLAAALAKCTSAGEWTDMSASDWWHTYEPDRIAAE